MSSKKLKRWKPTIGAALGPQEQRLVAWLGRSSGIVSDVETLFRVVTKKIATSRRRLPDPRVMQQKVGGIISRLNRKLKGRRVVVGDKPGTYRLRRVRP